MRLAIINITGGGISGGYKKYLKKILPRLATSSKIEKILCATPAPIKIKTWLSENDKIQHVICEKYRPFINWSDFKLKKNLNDFRPDIIFVPVERPFYFKNIPVINMLQTMEPLSPVNGNPLYEKLIQIIQYYDARKALKNSKRVIALSLFVKSYISEKWKISPKKINLIYHGIDSNKKKHVHSKRINDTLLGEKFIFTAGSLRPARGLEDILSAFLKLSDTKLKLIIAGKTSPRMHNYVSDLKRWVKDKKMGENIIWFENLNSSEMEFLYQNCKAFVMSSRVESFGMIAGEAMANGAICISANNPCLPEIFDNSALLYEPKNSEELSQKIKSILNLTEVEKNFLIKKSINRSKYFSWDICAERTVRCFQNAIG